MSIKSKIELSCDLCKHSPKTYECLAQATKDGWITINKESEFEDRLWVNYYICPHCIELITNSIKLRY